MADFDKIVLSYSGGLDTSVILKWLQETYNCEVVTYTADLGQGEELEPARAKAESMGVKEIFIDDVREEFVRDFVFPMFRANTIYEGEYLLGTSIARPLIAKRMVEIANEGADYLGFKDVGDSWRSGYDMTPEDYRAKWGLPHDYPMVAPNYAKKRQQLAKKIGLGRKPKAA